MLTLDRLPARLFDAAINVGAALEVPWGNVLKSIVGDPKRKYPVPAGFVDEFAAFGREKILDKLRTALRATVSFPYQRKVIGVRSQPDRTPTTLVAGERWFFLNGICTDHGLATVNAHELSKLFRRPVQLLYNNTDGISADLVECAFGKTLDSVTESVAPNFAPIVDALCDPEVQRVVLVSHSQGTIVAAVILKILHEILQPNTSNIPLVGERKPSPERELARQMANGNVDWWLVPDARARADFEAARVKLKNSGSPADAGKLEMYCFANCATSMAPFLTLPKPTRRVPWIESYGNEYDLVARLGVLASAHGAGSSRIEGDCYYNPETWGHLLNAHYLAPMFTAMRQSTGQLGAWVHYPQNLRQRPRLWDYVGGKTPASWP